MCVSASSRTGNITDQCLHQVSVSGELINYEALILLTAVHVAQSISSTGCFVIAEQKKTL